MMPKMAATLGSIQLGLCAYNDPASSGAAYSFFHMQQVDLSRTLPWEDLQWGRGEESQLVQN